jgi:hypothetical protein
VSPVLARPRSSRRPSALGGLAASAALVVIPVLLVGRLIAAEPSFVSEVTVVNPLVYKVNVDVRGPVDDGWSGLGTVRRETTKTVEQVVDQGATWTFRVTYGGEVGGEVTVGRAQLEAVGWRVTIPPEVGERLRQAGLMPSAP